MNTTMVGDMIIQTENNLTSLIGPAGCGKTRHAREMISQFAADGKRITVVNAYGDYYRIASDSITILETLDIAELVKLGSDMYIIDNVDEFGENAEATAHWLATMDKRVIVITQKISSIMSFREYVAENLISTKEVAKLLNVTKQHINVLTAKGTITPIIKTDHANWYWRQDIMEFANQKQLSRRKADRKPKTSVQDSPPQTDNSV